MSKILAVLFGLAVFFSCSPAKKVTSSGSRPAARDKVPAAGTRPAMDTVRWKPAPPGIPPAIGLPGGNQPSAGTGPDASVEYRVALLLPFLSDQFDPAAQQIPDKARPALQFYAGVQLALRQLSAGPSLRMAVKAVESYVDDAGFQTVLAGGALNDAQVIIGPLRSSQVEMLADKTSNTRQILISPIVPTSGLTQDNPGFVQLNPSLRAHCSAITRYVRSRMPAEQVVLVCKAKEANRLPYFQEVNTAMGGKPFRELILPDERVNFDQTDLQSYLRNGTRTAFLVPSWASQDFIMSFLLKLMAVKGSHEVEVFGMPQWENFENIEPEYLRKLNVHISSTSWIDRSRPEVQAFEQLFLDTFGTVPDEYAFHGYDAMSFAGDMLRRYGLSFPERLPAMEYRGLRGNLRFEKINASNRVELPSVWDYTENTAVRILKFENYGFRAVE